MKWFNVIRFVIGMALPFVFARQPYLMFVACYVCLILNNTIDDIVFYYANYGVNKRGYKGGMCSPVNGVVTLKESGVRLFEHLSKYNPVTHEQVMELSPYFGGEAVYNHIAVFMNRFNHHVVMNPGSRLVDVMVINSFDNLQPMVKDGELIADNQNQYLDNRAVVFVYSDCLMVVTLDKYVSEYILSNSVEKFNPEMIIMKGSQCDIYTTKDFCVNEGQMLNIYDTIVEGEKEDFDIDRYEIRYLVKRAVSYKDGLLGLVKDNVCKSIGTFCDSQIWLSCVMVSLILGTVHPVAVAVVAVPIYAFIFVRFYRHLMYSLMNIFGYKKWFSKSYSFISKLYHNGK